MGIPIRSIDYQLVQALIDILGGYCADLSTSMKFGTDVEQNILNSFFEGVVKFLLGPPYLSNPRWPLAAI